MTDTCRWCHGTGRIQGCWRESWECLECKPAELPGPYVDPYSPGGATQVTITAFCGDECRGSPIALNRIPQPAMVLGASVNVYGLAPPRDIEIGTPPGKPDSIVLRSALNGQTALALNPRLPVLVKHGMLFMRLFGPDVRPSICLVVHIHWREA